MVAMGGQDGGHGDIGGEDGGHGGTRWRPWGHGGTRWWPWGAMGVQDGGHGGTRCWPWSHGGPRWRPWGSGVMWGCDGAAYGSATTAIARRPTAPPTAPQRRGDPQPNTTITPISPTAPIPLLPHCPPLPPIPITPHYPLLPPNTPHPPIAPSPPITPNYPPPQLPPTAPIPLFAHYPHYPPPLPITKSPQSSNVALRPPGGATVGSGLLPGGSVGPRSHLPHPFGDGHRRRHPEGSPQPIGGDGGTGSREDRLHGGRGLTGRIWARGRGLKEIMSIYGHWGGA